ncbi:hypothetical protein LCGC14_2104060 [marine sediment metagenome]|uniref:N-terminal domain-containing protein n=1 Tax=marine sediment metagenome TaxID=412755 RepID=A0A0F9E968_9ZZZZ
MKYSKKEVQAYYADLRAQWNRAKQLLTDEKIKVIDAMIATHGLNISRTGYMIVSMQLQSQGLDGLPYLDAKTYKGWQENGFQVRKGEQSTLGSITWIGVKGKEKHETPDGEGKKGFMMPKAYKLFHRSQVEAA